jgi:hypothetical protein
MVSERIRSALLELAARDEADIVHAWGDVRLGLDDARDLCDCIEIADVIESLVDRYGQDRAPQVIRNFIRLLAVPATVETLQMMEKSSEAIPPL